MMLNERIGGVGEVRIMQKMLNNGYHHVTKTKLTFHSLN